MHVYRAELMFQGPMQKCMFLCTCSEMSPAWQLIDGVDFSNVTPSSYTPNLCRHAIAIKALHETGQILFASTSDGNCSSILNDVSFDNASQPITVLLYHMALFCLVTLETGTHVSPLMLEGLFCGQAKFICMQDLQSLQTCMQACHLT